MGVSSHGALLLLLLHPSLFQFLLRLQTKKQSLIVFVLQFFVASLVAELVLVFYFRAHRNNENHVPFEPFLVVVVLLLLVLEAVV